MNKQKDLRDLFLGKEYIEFYNNYKHEKDNIVDMLTGNKNRMCVCDTKKNCIYNISMRLRGCKNY